MITVFTYCYKMSMCMCIASLWWIAKRMWSTPNPNAAGIWAMQWVHYHGLLQWNDLLSVDVPQGADMAFESRLQRSPGLKRTHTTSHFHVLSKTWKNTRAILLWNSCLFVFFFTFMSHNVKQHFSCLIHQNCQTATPGKETNALSQSPYILLSVSLQEHKLRLWADSCFESLLCPCAG